MSACQIKPKKGSINGVLEAFCGTLSKKNVKLMHQSAKTLHL